MHKIYFPLLFWSSKITASFRMMLYWEMIFFHYYHLFPIYFGTELVVYRPRLYFFVSQVCLNPEMSLEILPFVPLNSWHIFSLESKLPKDMCISAAFGVTPCRLRFVSVVMFLPQCICIFLFILICDWLNAIFLFHL